MNHSIPNAIQSPLKCGDNLIIHALYSSEALGHDLAGFTIGHHIFPRSSSVAYLNGKGKLGGEEDDSPRERVNSGPGKRGRLALKAKNDVRTNTD